MTELGKTLKKKRSKEPQLKKNGTSIIELNCVNDFLFEMENDELSAEATHNQDERGILSRAYVPDSTKLVPEDFSFPRLPSTNDSDSFYFNDWRKRISNYEDKAGVHISPFERNIEVWKHLLFVMGKCEVLVQVLDARNPMFFWIEDIPNYLSSLNTCKISLALLNKADLLTSDQRYYLN